MSNLRCPRCNERVPDRQPVHLVCLFQRASYVILVIGGLVLLLTICGILFSN
jgi:hypothetical protein